MRLLIATLIFLLFGGSACGAPPATYVRDGDVIFHTSKSYQSLAIQRATGSRYSHMGIILFRKGHPYVFEAIGTVQFTPFEKWIARGEHGRFVIKRLQDADRILTEKGVRKLHSVALQFQGKPYDTIFNWSDSRIYCSELVWKIYDRAVGVKLGHLQKLREFRLSDPVVRKKMVERYGSRIPLDKPVISPGQMFQCSGLITLLEN
ncbi:MAG: YiiX family permuted papain-like enzyme [Pseudomonadota bacterium]